MKEYKTIRYSVKYFPNGKIQVTELKNAIISAKEIEKEILKNELISDLHDNLYNLCEPNFCNKNFKSNEHQVMDAQNNLEINKDYFKAIQKAINRTKNTIRDVIECNDWSFFCTFTFNKEKVDRYNYIEVSKKLRKFLSNYKQRYDSNFKYIIIPEQHEDGAFHFHGLIYTNRNDLFVDSGHVENNKVIYHWTNYNFGFNNFSYIEDIEKSRNYMMKYITKDLILNNEFCKRRFSCSQNCDRPIKFCYEKFNLDDFVEVYENDFCKIYKNIHVDI